ncbi:MAG TPA: aminoacyl-tRNA hydrolase [Clostridiaceae bacterium]|nr:aminoacyl-tRNA hydrolase [Clostridiaceae bacterium]
MDDLWLIVGLGNPGRRYDKTWHNVGRMGVDLLAKRHRIAMRRRRFGGVTGEGRIAGQRVLLLQPNTYMNRSGESLIRAVSFYKIPIERIIVLYDDYDIPLRRIRIRKTGSAGSHNGMKSIINHLKDQRFWRVRIGIGPRPAGDIVAFVLDKIGSGEEYDVARSLEDAADATELILRGEDQIAQERFNKKGTPDIERVSEQSKGQDISKAASGTVRVPNDKAGQCAEGE